MPLNKKKSTQGKNQEQKRWLEFSSEVPFEYVEPVASLFSRYGQGGAVIEHSANYNPDEGESLTLPPKATVRTYLPLDEEFKQNHELIHIGVALIAKLNNDVANNEREINEKEWVESWKSHFTTLHIGKGLVIKPPWERKISSPDHIEIVIDPGLAFGTGHHPTTKMTLECTERLLSKGMLVLDIGSGSGILSIAASKLGASKVYGLEIDTDAIKSSETNVRVNKCQDRIIFKNSSLPETEINNLKFDLVLANISAKTLSELSIQIRSVMNPRPLLIASGVLLEQSKNLQSVFSNTGFKVIEEHQEDDWVALVCMAI